MDSSAQDEAFVHLFALSVYLLDLSLLLPKGYPFGLGLMSGILARVVETDEEVTIMGRW